MRVTQSLSSLILLVLILFTAYLRYLTNFFEQDTAVLESILASLIVLFLAYLINSLAGDFIQDRVSSAKDRYTLRKTVSVIVTVLAAASFFAIWIERTSTLIIAYGILSAGIAIALQDLLRGVAGGLLIVTTNPFKAGDRIQVGENIGDVLDIGFQYQAYGNPGVGKSGSAHRQDNSDSKQFCAESADQKLYPGFFFYLG